MINGVAILFGLVAMVLIALVGGWLILLMAHAFLTRYHELSDYCETRGSAKGSQKEKARNAME